MRRIVAAVGVFGVVVAGLSVVPASSVAPAAAAVAPAGDGDVPVAQSTPVQGLEEPADPAESVDALPNDLADLPGDEISTAPAEETWTEVPDMPVEVRVPEDAIAPAPPSGDDPTAPLDPDAPSAAPTTDPSDAPTDAPTDESALPPSTGPEVIVSWDRPSDLARGVVLLSVEPVADSAGGGVEGAGVRVDYSSFDQLYGAGWADRLVVHAYPACFATTPEEPECAQSIAVPSINNTDTDLLRFTTLTEEQLAAGFAESGADSLVPDGTTDSSEDSGESGDLAPDSLVGGPGDTRRAGTGSRAGADEPGSTGPVYAVSSAPGGYGAVPISPAGEWQVGPGSGEFSYSYPFQAPPSVGGSAPELGLVYSSGSVDGLSTTESGQASPAGVGWNLEPGYISRSYRTCREDTTDADHPSGGKQDFCWRTDDGVLVDELTLSLNGQVARLVPAAFDANGAATQWRMKTDPGWKIERFRAAGTPAANRPANADNDNEGFRVTTQDGTQYWFGYGRDNTNSVWTMPVFANHNNPADEDQEPCWNATAKQSFCQQGWRWNLDRVVDPSGNTIRYTYDPESNYYQAWGELTDAPTRYDRGGLLAKVEYGFRGTDAPQQRVILGSTFRCTTQLSNPALNCAGGNTPKGDVTKWPDVPTNLYCESAGTCELVSPAFFTIRRYSSITTEVRKPDGTFETVDVYTLKHTMPDPDGAGDSTADLWLDTITHTGHAGDATPLSVADTDFGAVAKPNKIVAPDGEEYEKFRVYTVRNETGGRVDVSYGHETGQDCTWAEVNGTDRWSPPGECFAQVHRANLTGPDTETDWFHKYVVTHVAVGDDTFHLRNSNPASNDVHLTKAGFYKYDYQGAPGWRFAGSPNSPTALESWTDWRGYQTTLIRARPTTLRGEQAAASVPDLAKQRIVRFRGMSQNPATPGQVNDTSLPRAVVRLDTEEFATSAEEPEDFNYLEGLTAETSTLNGDGSLITRTYTDYGSIPTADVAGEHPRTAKLTITKATRTHTAEYNASGTQTGTRTREFTYNYVSESAQQPTLALLAGALISSTDKGDTGVGDDVCAWNAYQSNATAWIRVPAETKTFNGGCPGSPATNTNFVARSTKTYDDGGSLSRGLPTDTYTWLTPAGDPGTGTDVTHTHTEYDDFGRVTKTVGPGDTAHELTTLTEYNPGGQAGQPLTELKVTQVDVMATARPTPYAPSTKDIVTTTTLDPGRNLPLTVTDPNGGVTRVKYNPLGQPIEVRYPSQGSGDPASVIYSYTYSAQANAPARIHTQTLRDVVSGNPVYDDSYSFYDGWARQVQTQMPQPETPTAQIVTVTGYDERGLVRYAAPETAGGTGFDTVFNADPATVPRYTLTSYDGAGRPTLVEEKSNTTVVATTATSYRGTKTVLTPPVGGVTVTDLDIRERPTRVALYETASTTVDPVDAVGYTYTPRGELATATKTLATPGGPTPFTWSYGYDMTGRQIWTHDPDTGSTVTEYDDAGNPTTVTTGPIGKKTETLDLTDSYHPAVVEPSAVITTSYDRLSRPVSKFDETDPDEPVTVTTWGYDKHGIANSIGRSTSTTHPITGLNTTLIEEVLGDPIEVPGAYESRALGYDAQGQPTSTSETYPVWITDETPDNNPAHPAETITRVWSTAYNKAGQPTQVDYPAVPGLPAASIDYAYTTGGRVRTINLDEPGDSLRLAQVTYNNIGRTRTLTSGSYTSGTLATGLKRTYAFEPDTGRFNTLDATITPATATGAAGTPYSAFGLDYAYDKNGNPTLIKGTATDPEAAEQTGYWCYNYDGLNRLTRARTGNTSSCATPTSAPAAVTGQVYDLTYQHNADRLTAVIDNLHNTPGSNPQPLRVDYATGDANADGDDEDSDGDGQRPHHNTELTTQALQAEVFDWPDEMPAPGVIDNDDQGRIARWTPDLELLDLLNLTDIGDTGPISSAYEYTYNNLGQLTASEARGLPPLLPDPLSSSIWYAYRDDGTRLVRQNQDLSLGIQQTITVYLADGTEITRKTALATTNSVRTFTTPGGTPIATQTSTSASGATGGTNHQAEWNWLAADAQDSLRLTYKHNPTGASTPERHHYYPYGDPTTTRTPETPTGAGYLNKPHDRSGDIRLDQRNYTANLNTLTTPDPLLDTTDPQSFNPYAYSRNNPIANADPSGLKFDTPNGTSSTPPPRCIGSNATCVANNAPPSGWSKETGGLLDAAAGAVQSTAEGIEFLTPHAHVWDALGATLPSEYLADTWDDLGVDTDTWAYEMGYFFALPIPLVGGAAPWIRSLKSTRHTRTTRSTADGLADAANAGPSAQEIIQSTARTEAGRGVGSLRSALSPAERAAMDAEPSLTSRMLGQAVHRRTASALEEAYPGRFWYRTRGPDFVDRQTGELLELTTPGEVGKHMARPGPEYGPGLTFCIYVLPSC